jgi:autotransporter-associated beta strand protein
MGRSYRLSAALVATIVLSLGRIGSAADVLWNVTGPADWNTAANWSPARVPTGTDNATSNNNGIATFSTNVTDQFTDLRFGDGAASGGSVTQSAGTIIASGLLRMNISGSANSNYTLIGGSATFSRINVNESAGAGGANLNVEGGVVTVPESNVGNGAGALFIGGGTGGGNGTVNVPAGTLSVGADTAGNQSIVVGSGGTSIAQLNVSGTGVVTVVGTGDMNVGAASPGIVTQTGGTVNLFTGPGATSWLHVGRQSNGTYTMSGGTLTDPNELSLADNGGVTGTFNLNGGTLTVGGIASGSGTGIFNFNGGTLRFVGSGPFGPGFGIISAANVQNGGAIIDSNGLTASFYGPLLNAGTGGLTKIGAGQLSLFGTSSTFVGGTVVNAGAVVIEADGSLGAVPASPTTNVTLNGGTLGFFVATTLNANRSIQLNTSGGTIDTQGNAVSVPGVISGNGALTKIGTGTLTLSGNNTFAGPVNVNAGTLTLSDGVLAADVHDQAEFVYNGGAFNGRVFLAGTVTFNAPFTAGNGMENDTGLTIASGQSIMLNGLGLDNEATLTMAGGTLTLSTGGSAANLNRGNFNLSATVPFNLGGATLTNAGTINLDGGLLSSGGNLINNPGGIVTGNGTIQSGFSNSGGTLVVGGGTTNITPAITNSGLIQLTAANSDLIGGTITNNAAGTIQGVGVVGNSVTNIGTIEPFGGTLSISGILLDPVGGLIRVGTGNKLLVTQGLQTSAGIVSLTGGTFDNGGRPLNNLGQISGYGTFATGGTGLDNNGSITFSGGLTTVNGPVTNENGKTILVAYNPALFTGLVTNNGGGTFNIVSTTAVFAGGSTGTFSGTFTNNANSAFSLGGNGVLEVDGAPSLGAVSSMAVGGTSTLRFKPTSGSASVATGVTATVASGAALELAGSVSALSSGGNHVNILDNSAAPGVLVSGTNQQVGNIDGSGTTQVNAGSDLTANHIIQSVLVIGGTATSHGLVTIDASDAAGNPLTNGSPGTLTPGDQFRAAASIGDSATTALGLVALVDLPDGSTGRQTAVPEPASLVQFVIGVMAVGGLAGWRRSVTQSQELRTRFNARRHIVLRTVDQRADRKGRHLVGWVRSQQGQQHVFALELRIEPEVVSIGREDHRHPIMDLDHQHVGIGRDEGTRFDRFAVPAPMLGQPGECEGAIFLQPDIVRLLRLGVGALLPLVEAVRDDQAPAPLERRAKRRLVGDCLRAGVDHAVADFRIVGPRRDQPPVAELPLPLAVLQRDRQHLLSRRDVVAQSEVGDFEKPECLGDFLRRRAKCESTAHGIALSEASRDPARVRYMAVTDAAIDRVAVVRLNSGQKLTATVRL